MDFLPQEIFDSILKLLDEPGCHLPELATISRRWQWTIEPVTFKNIHLKSTDLVRFQQVVQGERRRYVNTIYYYVILPQYADAARCRFEVELDRQENDEVFTDAIHGLFNALAGWDPLKDGYIQLNLRDVYSPSDHNCLRSSPPVFHWIMGLGRGGRGECGECGERGERGERDSIHDIPMDIGCFRYYYSYIRLRRPSELPKVPVVKVFIRDPTTRTLSDCVGIDIVGRLPSLEEAHFRLNTLDNRYISLRRMQRSELVRAIREALPESSGLESLSIIGRGMPHSPHFSVGTLHPEVPGSATDPLSTAIRMATGSLEKLKRLHIEAEIDRSLFCPSPTSGLSQPYWQNLERFTVRFSTRRPSGGLYFKSPRQRVYPPPETENPPGYGHADEYKAVTDLTPFHHKFGGVFNQRDDVFPNDASLMPLFEAFGQACLQMPRLKSAELTTYPGNPRDKRLMEFGWGVWYLSPYTCLEPLGPALYPPYPIGIPTLHERAPQRRIIWKVWDWRPRNDVRRLIRKIGSAEHGADLVETFSDVGSLASYTNSSRSG